MGRSGRLSRASMGRIHIPPNKKLPKADLPCKVCGRVFKTDDGLTHHMKNKHGENK
jgi:hypothetical protein